MNERLATMIRVSAILLGTILAIVAGWVVFVRLPGGNMTRLLGILLVVGLGVLGARFGARLVRATVEGYDVAQVTVSGPITRNGGRTIPSSPMGVPADDIVEQIERADDDRNVDALIVKLNTPGGAVVPSDDIHRAAAAFDGPTAAYATDVCASGGYWIASGCDAIFAREGSIVGSIGVIGSRINASELADKLGLSYERFAAGRFKDAGVSLKEMDEEEREYLQGLIDGFYDDFVERVTEGRDGLSAEAVRDTEARVYLGEDARELGLVDELGTRDDVESHLADELEIESVVVREFEPPRRFRVRLLGGAQQIAYSFGAGLASVLGAEDAEGFKIELR